MNKTEIEAQLKALARILRDCDEQLARPSQTAEERGVLEDLRMRFEAKRDLFEVALAAVPTRAVVV